MTISRNNMEVSILSIHQSEEEFLKNYNPKKYVTPDGYTSDTAVFTIVSEDKEFERTPPKRTLKIMLIQRSDKSIEGYPNIEGGKWALPGGFILPSESAYEGALRELESETGIKNDHLKHFGVYDKPDRDKRGWIISNAFYAIVREQLLENRKASDDARDVALFTLEEAFKLDLAFDHKQIITDALELIKKDMIQTTVAKNFLSRNFTLSELRDVLLTVVKYPSIEEKSVFFKKTPTLSFIKLVEDEDGNPITTSRHSFRPARLYQFIDVEKIASIYE